jgi:hypothetical protein
MRETHGKSPEAIARLPATFPNEPVESVKQHGCGDCLLKGPSSIARKPDDRLGPGCRVMPSAGNVSPHDVAGFLGHGTRKGTVDPDESLPNELLYLSVAERERAQTIISHGRLSCRWIPARGLNVPESARKMQLLVTQRKQLDTGHEFSGIRAKSLRALPA